MFPYGYKQLNDSSGAFLGYEKNLNLPVAPTVAASKSSLAKWLLANKGKAALMALLGTGALGAAMLGGDSQEAE